MLDLTALTAEVTRYETLEASVEALLTGQSDAIKAAVAKAISETQATDQATLDAINTAAQAAVDGVTAEFKTGNDKLSTAVTANTTAAPAA